MDKLFKILVLVLFVVFGSCDRHCDEPLDGHCDNPIKLSTDKLSFEKEGGTKEIVVSDKQFGLQHIYLNDRYIQDEKDGLERIKEDNAIIYKHNDFLIKLTDKKIIVTMPENKSKTTKYIGVGIHIANCLSRFTITQK